MLLYSHQVKDAVMLGAIPNEFSNLIELSFNVHPTNQNVTRGWIDVIRQTLESGSLSSTIDSQ